jgi:hypothetical protein
MLLNKAICINCRRPVQRIERKQHTDQGHTVLVLPSECKVTFAPKRRDGQQPPVNERGENDGRQ